MNLFVPEHIWLSASKPEIREIAPVSSIVGTVAILVGTFPHVPDDDWSVLKVPGGDTPSTKVVEVRGILDKRCHVSVFLRSKPADSDKTRLETGVFSRNAGIVDKCELWPANDLTAWLANVVADWQNGKPSGWKQAITTKRIVLMDSRTLHPWYIEKRKAVKVNWRKNAIFQEPRGPWLFPVRGHSGFTFQGVDEQPNHITEIDQAIASGLIALE